MARRGWSQVFPLPLVAIVVLLAVLIFLTPNLLLGGGPAAGSLATQAQLTIDVPPGSNLTHFYVNGLGDVRYAEIAAALSTNLSWPAPDPLVNVTWTNVSVQFGVLAATFTTWANPVALNVTATYVDAAGATVVYWGLYEFYISGSMLESKALAVGQTALPATPLDALPITILLATASPGAVP